MNIYMLAQIFGLLGAISMLLSSWQKTKNKILSFLILDSFFYFIQYILLGALSGAFANIVGLIRTIVFRYKDSNRYFDNKIILYLIILFYTIIGIKTYDGLISVFPIIVSILYTIILWQNNIKKIRIGTSIMILSFIIYNIGVGAYIGVIVESILFISSLGAIIKIDILQDKRVKQIDKIVKQ